MYGQSIGIETDNLMGLITQLKGGLPVSSFSRLSKLLDVPEKMLAVTVNIPQRTLTRRKKEGRLKSDESERVFRLAGLFERALIVFGNEDTARQWFHQPVKGFGGRTPLAFADTEPGAREVEDMLGRIEEGVFY
jgi:putative toxin-antitoxin system antitoxin component (TIGR02293 family)